MRAKNPTRLRFVFRVWLFAHHTDWTPPEAERGESRARVRVGTGGKGKRRKASPRVWGELMATSRRCLLAVCAFGGCFCRPFPPSNAQLSRPSVGLMILLLPFLTFLKRGMEWEEGLADLLKIGIRSSFNYIYPTDRRVRVRGL